MMSDQVKSKIESIVARCLGCRKTPCPSDCPCLKELAEMP